MSASFGIEISPGFFLMEELPPDLIEALLRTAPRRKRKKKIARSYHSWFYDIPIALGVCSNPSCNDPRGKPKVFVWEHPSGETMCRFCFLGGWLAEGD